MRRATGRSQSRAPPTKVDRAATAHHDRSVIPSSQDPGSDKLRDRPTLLPILGPGPQRFATLVGAALNLSSINPIKALFWSAVINGGGAAPVMALMMHLSS